MPELAEIGGTLQVVDATTILVHELQHAADYDLGVYDDTRHMGSGIKFSEIRAVRRENQMRARRPGFPIRLHYGFIAPSAPAPVPGPTAGVDDPI